MNGGTCNLNNAVLKNCGGSTPYYNYSIQPAAVEVDSGGKLLMTNTIIKNSIGHGIFSFQGNVTATNCLVEDCGGEALAVVLGGKDSFNSCTFANYSTSSISHLNNPTVGIVNWLQISQTEYIYSNLNAVLRNCIVWGSLDSELVCDTSGSPAGTQAYLQFDHCLLKKGKQTETFVQMNACFNQDPLFKDPTKDNFHIPATSPAVGKGVTAYEPIYDLDWNARLYSTGGYDVGCYQHSN